MEAWKLWFCIGFLEGSGEDKRLPKCSKDALKEGAEWMREQIEKEEG